MKNLFIFTTVLLFTISNVHANERAECLKAVENGKEIIDVNDMKVFSYNGKTYTFRDKSNRCFERALR
jgi:hypothetical protein